MTTEKKIVTAVYCGVMGVALGIYAFVVKRNDRRAEEEHEAFMKSLCNRDARMDNLKSDE